VVLGATALRLPGCRHPDGPAKVHEEAEGAPRGNTSPTLEIYPLTAAQPINLFGAT
jgi:hypothetical protein